MITISQQYNKKFEFIINVLYILAILSIAFFVLKYAFIWILPFLIALGVSLLVDPLITWLESKIKIKRGWISTVVITVVLILFGTLLTLLSTTIINEIKNIFNNFGAYLNSIAAFVQQLPDKYGHLFNGKFYSILNEIIEFLKDYNYASLLSGSVGSGALKYAGSFISSLPSVLVFMIVTIVATYFTSATFPDIKKFVLKQVSDKTQEIIKAIKFHFFNTVVKYLKSYCILMLITFAELTVAFFIFDIKPTILLAFLISVLDILPILGVGTILIPWALIELIIGHPIQALIIIGIYLVVTIVRQVLEPKIISDHVGLPPIVTLFCIYIGLQLFGVLGMFAFPITLIIIKNLQESGHIKIWK